MEHSKRINNSVDRTKIKKLTLREISIAYDEHCGNVIKGKWKQCECAICVPKED
jgi:hypothetical protein